MFYENYYWGMNVMWWLVWMFILVWIFAVPYDIPGQRNRRETALDILQKRFAAGQISMNEYNEKKQLVNKDRSGLN